jgi:hypothetical protein
LFNIADNSIDKMHDVPMPTEFFQLYDGTLKITGVKKLLWKQQPINEKDIQVLSAADRRFPFLPPPTDFQTKMDLAASYFEECRSSTSPPEQAAMHFIDLATAWSRHYAYPSEVHKNPRHIHDHHRICFCNV